MAGLSVADFLAQHGSGFSAHCRAENALHKRAYLQAIESDALASLTQEFGEIHMEEVMGPAAQHPEKAVKYMREVIMGDRHGEMPDIIMKYLEIAAQKCKKTGCTDDLLAAAICGDVALSLGESEKLFGPGVRELANDGLGGSSRRVFEFLFTSTVYSYEVNYLLKKTQGR
eukprot:comp20237_c0_seq1/m.25245 comp20237_c0_seq1/g.25245  ORF comp20237_c0_seq1/g.25245 comp20237_c0_seq1/m.25245 type:complete len:171 (-) comp20237_c0_seq1:437-949(-)